MSSKFNIPPPVLAMISLLGIYLCGRYLSVDIFPVVWKNILFGLFMCIAMVIAIWALLQMWQVKTTISPCTLNKTHYLITTGIFSLTRNPMYLSLALMLLAFCFLWMTVFGFMGVFFFIVIINERQILAEELALEQQFGQIYKDYCQQVRCWL